MNKMPTTHTVLRAASRVTDISVNLITSASRVAHIVLIRDACAAISKQHLCQTDRVIARALRRDRSSVSMAIGRHKKRMVDNTYYQTLVKAIEDESGISIANT